MARVICKAKQNGRVKHRGNPTIEFYKDGKPDSKTDPAQNQIRQRTISAETAAELDFSEVTKVNG